MRLRLCKTKTKTKTKTKSKTKMNKAGNQRAVRSPRSDERDVLVKIWLGRSVAVGLIGAPRWRASPAVEALLPQMYSHGEVELWRIGGAGQEPTGQASPERGESFFRGLVG